ncbi:MAG: BspA family leucine-rich repeat surface protein [Bacilli bacterium]|nr:BspA family leucine-rich repeat surface protein [Bacilli bacterium]
MQVVNKKMCVIVILVLVIIESCTLFLMYKSYGNKNTNLDEVNLNISNSNMFAIMLEQDDGTYKEDTSNTWPTSGYTYNESVSGCIDINGNKLDGVLSYDSTNNIATVDTGNTSYCYLYFSLPPTAFAVYSADDTSLTFYKNKDSVTAGQQYKGKTATAVYTGIEDEYYMGNWSSYSSTITSVVVADEISPKFMAQWFYGFNNPSLTMDLFKIDISNVTSMNRMFWGSSVANLEIELWDVSNVTNMYGMFYNCSNLVVDLSRWQTNVMGVWNYCGFNYNAPGVIPPSSFGEPTGYSDIVCQQGGGA